MTVNPEDNITSVQAAIAVASMIIGVGILTLPRTVADTMGTPDGWIAVILGGFISMGAGYVVAKLSQRFPGQTFYQYSRAVAGKFFGWLFSLFLIVYFTVLAGFEARTLGEVARIYLLDKTPIELIIISFMSVGTYLVAGGVNPMVRMFEFYFPFIAFIFFSVILLNFRGFEIDNMRPVLGQGVMPVVKGVQATALSYLGFEAMLILTAFMEKPGRAVRAVLAGIGIPVLFYLIMVAMVIGDFGVDEVKTLTWPTIAMAKEIEFPGAFFERFESFFMVVWTLAIYTTFVPAYYFACLGLSELFNRDNRYFIYGILPVMYIAAMYPQDLNGVFKLGDYIGYMGAIAAGAMPLTLLIAALIRGKGRGQKRNQV